MNTRIISTLFISGAIAATVQPALGKINLTESTKEEVLKAASQGSRSTKTNIKLAQALPPEQINLRAKQITVRIDGANLGSGAIIAESNNVYTVLTNWHVMRNPGQYSVQTIDGRKHQVNPASIKQIGGLDLAIVKFESDQNYQVAQLGDSRNIIEGQNIYFAGYPGELRPEDSRYYRFFAANLVGILPKSTANGYSLIYNGEAFPGMSGGPVLDRYGNLIGIHGEANINAITGGTSNYAIPINAYQQAIAQSQSSSTASNSNNTNNNSPALEVPEVIIETQPAEDNIETETSSNPDTADTNISNPLADEPSSEENAANSNENTTNTAEEPKPTESNISSIPTFSSGNSSSDRNSSANVSTTESPEASQNLPTPSVLVSNRTGIDYRPLQRLLEAKQWEEADRQTYQLIARIVESAKQQNQNIFIELKTIAEFACSDVKTIDSLWQKYSGKQFGFTPQQQIWQNVNQNGDFSTETWRRFATRVGWKQGEIANAGGYLLYEQLNFDPERAPAGHLPWWFALPEEQQNVLKHLFKSCSLGRPTSPVRADASSSSNNNQISDLRPTKIPEALAD